MRSVASDEWLGNTRGGKNPWVQDAILDVCVESSIVAKPIEEWLQKLSGAPLPPGVEEVVLRNVQNGIASYMRGNIDLAKVPVLVFCVIMHHDAALHEVAKLIATENASNAMLEHMETERLLLFRSICHNLNLVDAPAKVAEQSFLQDCLVKANARIAELEGKITGMMAKKRICVRKKGGQSFTTEAVLMNLGFLKLSRVPIRRVRIALNSAASITLYST